MEISEEDPAISEWNEQLCLRLIELYRLSPLLWHKKHPNYFKKAKKDAAWQTIGLALDKSPQDCKHKMSVLYSSFRREKAKIMKSIQKCRCSEGHTMDNMYASYASNWFGFKAMSFLLIKQKRPEEVFKRKPRTRRSDTLKKLTNEALEAQKVRLAEIGVDTNTNNKDRSIPSTPRSDLLQKLTNEALEAEKARLAEIGLDTNTNNENRSILSTPRGDILQKITNEALEAEKVRLAEICLDTNTINKDRSIPSTARGEILQKLTNEALEAEKVRLAEVALGTNTTKKVRSIPSTSESTRKTDAASSDTAKDEELKFFSDFVASKMKKYSENTRSAVQQAICDILFKADKSHYERSNATVTSTNTMNMMIPRVVIRPEDNVQALIVKEEDLDSDTE